MSMARAGIRRIGGVEMGPLSSPGHAVDTCEGRYPENGLTPRRMRVVFAMDACLRRHWRGEQGWLYPTILRRSPEEKE